VLSLEYKSDTNISQTALTFFGSVIWQIFLTATQKTFPSAPAARLRLDAAVKIGKILRTASYFALLVQGGTNLRKLR